jgi:hypothetical protein
MSRKAHPVLHLSADAKLADGGHNAWFGRW